MITCFLCFGVWIFVTITVVYTVNFPKSSPATEQAFTVWYSHFRKGAEEAMFNQVAATWAYETNITDTNEQIMIAATEANAKFSKDKSIEMNILFPNARFTNETNRRLHHKLKKIGDFALPAADFKELIEIKSRMDNRFSTAKICRNRTVTNITLCHPNDTLSLDPDITHIMDSSRDYDELLYIWTKWRDASGKQMRTDYIRYIDLKNTAARADGFSNNAEAWRDPFMEPDFDYKDSDFMSEIAAIWETMRPLYEQLHAYMRTKLIDLYGSEKVTPNGPIPAHLLGNMWSQSWLSLQNFTIPFKSKPPLDVTAEMIRQNWTALKMFQTADKFFQDLGLIKMPATFWNNSMIEKPIGRDVACHPSAWNFFNGYDYRIKQCTSVNMHDLLVIHHEMGHIEYFMQYKNLPVTFAEGANEGFHEAIGDTLALSVSTPSHLQKLGLLKGHNASDTEVDINFMFVTALDKIAFLPFGLTLDLYRFDVFSGVIGKHELNARWWEYIVKYQGICTAVKRSEEDFDPGSKYHVPADVPYMRYFVSFILLFQFHDAMCKASGHSGPLYTCDFDGSKTAGKLIADGLALGSSKPWQYALQKMTGQTKMDSRPLMAFFEPLHRFLEEENRKTGSRPGWTNDVYCPVGPPPAATATRNSAVTIQSVQIRTTMISRLWFIVFALIKVNGALF